jgi:hypothetical protein
MISLYNFCKGELFSLTISYPVDGQTRFPALETANLARFRHKPSICNSFGVMQLPINAVNADTAPLDLNPALPTTRPPGMREIARERREPAFGTSDRCSISISFAFSDAYGRQSLFPLI